MAETTFVLTRRRLSVILKRVLSWSTAILIQIGTLPYYRFYQFNTLKPLQAIEDAAQSRQNAIRLVRLLARWRLRKLAELQFIQISCAILAAGIIGCFSWQGTADAYWLSPALWYLGLALAVLGILTSAQQTAVLDLLGSPKASTQDLEEAHRESQRYIPLILSPLPGSRSLSPESHGKKQYKLRKKMVFAWQAPMMLMAYAMSCFLAGLTLYICTPLIKREPFDTGSYIAITYLTGTFLAGCTFLYCTFWIYHYVDLEHEGNEYYITRNDDRLDSVALKTRSRSIRVAFQEPSESPEVQVHDE